MKRVCLLYLLFFAAPLYAGDLSQVSEEGMSLWQLIMNGGWVMAVLGVCSVFAVTLTLFFLITVRSAVFIPSSQLLEIKKAVERKDIEKVKALCKSRKNFLEKVVYTGASNRKEPTQVFRLKMEEEARRSIELHWQKISFLSDIAVVSPMLGLWGPFWA